MAKLHPDLLSVQLRLQLAPVDWDTSVPIQVMSILKHLEMSQEQRDASETIRQDLERVIKSQFPGAAVTVYGSVKTGLSLCSSDVDFSLNLKYSQNVLSTLTRIIKQDNAFKNTKSYDGKFPFIRSLHGKSDTEFDLTFNNEAAIATSELLARINEIDPRALQLTLLFKIWCQVHCLIAPGCFNTISVYMLVIFYLQQQGILPSVQSLMNRDQCKYVDGYNVTLNNYKYMQFKENIDVVQLLRGLFEFYSKFEWSLNVVSPFTGQIHSKKDFNRRNMRLNTKLSQYYTDYMKQTTSDLGSHLIVIQHALFHSRNCSDNVKPGKLKYFRKCITEAAQLYSKNNEKSFLRNILLPQENPHNLGEGLRWSVAGLPASVSQADLVKLFAKYGKISVENMDTKYMIAIIKFKNKSSVRQLMSEKCIQLNGVQLKVTYFGNNGQVERFARSNEKSDIIAPSEIALTGDFNRQLEMLLAAITLTPEEINNINQLYTDIENVLQNQWPGCKVVPYGSITTGLGIKSSDADCYISGAWGGDEAARAVNVSRKILNKRKDLFADILRIRANTPIVKLFHLPTQTNCDISFKTPLGTQNSKLIAFLLRSDPRLIPISVVIKYWAKIHGLSGSGPMSNYALTMLVIFYLQQPPLNILPAVHSLQKQVTQHQMVDGWNTGFAETHLPDATHDHRQHSIPHLLAGFFQFYATFDFNKYVVCPYLGRPIEKALFDKPDSLPEEFALYKINVSIQRSLPLKISSALCVQDPFEQCHNVASAICDSFSAKIKAYFKFASEAYDLNGCNGFLKNILLEKPILEDMSKPKKRQSQPIANKLCILTGNNIVGNWHDVVRQILHCIFNELLNMKMKNNITKIYEKSVTYIYSTNIDTEIWQRCQRSLLSRATKLNLLESIKCIKDKFELIGDTKINVPVVLTFIFRNSNKQCKITLTLEDHANDDREIFEDFSTFVTVVIPMWFRNLLNLYDNNNFNNTDYRKEVTLKGYEIKAEEIPATRQDTIEKGTNKNYASDKVTESKLSNATSNASDRFTENNQEKDRTTSVSNNECKTIIENDQGTAEKNKLIKDQPALSFISCLLQKEIRQIKNSDWHTTTREILHCIFHEILTLEMKEIDTNIIENKVIYKYSTNITREVWDRCQRCLLSKATKLGSSIEIQRINNTFVLFGDSVINIHLLLEINLDKSVKVCYLQITPMNYNDVGKQILEDFTAFLRGLLPTWFRKLVHLSNTNNFNNADYRKDVTLNGYEISAEENIATKQYAIEKVTNENYAGEKVTESKLFDATCYASDFSVKNTGSNKNKITDINQVNNKSISIVNNACKTKAKHDQVTVDQIKNKKAIRKFYYKKKTNIVNTDTCTVNNQVNDEAIAKHDVTVDQKKNKKAKSKFYYKKKSNIVNTNRCTVSNTVNDKIITKHDQATVDQNKSKQAKQKKKTINPAIPAIYILLEREIQQIKDPLWHPVVSKILNCILHELLTMKIKHIDTNVKDKKVLNKYSTNITRKAWDYSQRCLLGKATKLNSPKEIQRINDLFALVGDGDINVPIVVEITLPKTTKECYINFTLENENYDDKQIFDDFSDFIYDLLPAWFGKLVQLYNANNFNDLNIKRNVTLYEYESIVKNNSNQIIETNKNNTISKRNSQTRSNDIEISCDSNSNVSSSSSSNNVTDLERERSEATLKKGNPILTSYKYKIAPLNTQIHETVISINLNNYPHVAIDSDWKVILRRMVDTIFEMMLLMKLDVVSTTRDNAEVTYSITTNVGQFAWRICQEYRLLRAIKLGLTEQKKEIIANIAKVGNRDITLPINVILDFLEDTKECDIFISSGNTDVEDHTRIEDIHDFARYVMSEWFQILLDTINNSNNIVTNETSHDEILLRVMYGILENKID